jgi:hypothetical protein
VWFTFMLAVGGGFASATILATHFGDVQLDGYYGSCAVLVPELSGGNNNTFSFSTGGIAPTPFFLRIHGYSASTFTVSWLQM